MALHDAGRDKDVNPGKEGGERPLSQQLHLHVDQEVSGLVDLSLQVDGSREAVEFPGAEITLLVALYDADDDLIAGVGGRRADPEDLCGRDDVGLEAEMVIGDADRRALTVKGVSGTADPLAACVGRLFVVMRTVEGETPESSLKVKARLSVRTVVGASCAFVNISAGMSVGGHDVSVRRTGTLIAAFNVHTLEGTQVPDALGALVNIFTGACVLLQVVALATVALIRAVDVGALLAAGLFITLVDIFTVLAVRSEGEAGCA